MIIPVRMINSERYFCCPTRADSILIEWKFRMESQTLRHQNGGAI